MKGKKKMNRSLTFQTTAWPTKKNSPMGLKSISSISDINSLITKTYNRVLYKQGRLNRSTTQSANVKSEIIIS